MSAIAATRICISVYRQVTAKLFYIVFLTTELLVGYASVQLSSRFCVRLWKKYVTPVAFYSRQYKRFYSSDNLHCKLIN